MKFRMNLLMTAVVFPVLLVAQGATERTAVFSMIRENRMSELQSWVKKNRPDSVADKLGNQPLHHAALYGSPEAVKVLLEAGAPTEVRNTGEVTPLIYAATDLAKVKLLVAKGADVKAVSRQGRTALHVAAGSTDALAIARMLLAKGADVNAADGLGQTPLICAEMSQTELIGLLVRSGADVNATSASGTTALMNAAGSNNVAAARLLLSKGAKVNAANTMGGRVPRGEIALKKLTPLMLAAPYGSAALVKVLLDAGADVTPRDVRGMTALMLALGSDHQDAGTVQLLLAAGSDVNAKDANGETVMDWERKNPNPAILNLLNAKNAKGAVMAVAAPKAGQPVALQEAVARGLRLMERSSPTFFKDGGCVSCHHQVPAAMAVKAVREAGLAYNRVAAAEQAKTITAVTVPFGASMLQGQEIGGGTDSATSAALGAMAYGIEAGAASDLLVHYIASKQKPDGSWSLQGVGRPPMEETDMARTAYAVKVLQHYGWAGRKAEFTERIERAKGWLESAVATTTYDEAELLLGLVWTDSKKAEAVRQRLIALQRADGGWAQKAEMAPDAYATGLALYALREGGMAVTHPVYGKGVEYLRRTQLADGSWFVASRAPKFQPYFQSGFPHDHDQWISAIATAYAVRAMAPAVAGERVVAAR
ncbi:MAG: ankyrin repeat domain-containing protein [Bryobacterales bacterium]|nr:ankyrin repeat domain-containing protein [Bryobacterales bacterium]